MSEQNDNPAPEDLPVEEEEQVGGIGDLTDEFYDQFDEIPEERGDFDESADDAPDNTPDPMDDPDSPQYQIQELRQEIERLREPIVLPSPFPRVFMADKKTDGTWTECISVAGALLPRAAGEPRNCSSSGAASAIIVANSTDGTFVPVLELDDPPDKRYYQLSNSVLPGSITASSGGPTSFAYTAQTYTGTTLVKVRNGAEPFNGSPGKLGITISSSGTTSSGCTVKAIGVGYETLFWPDPTVPGGFVFSAPNSGEP